MEFISWLALVLLALVGYAVGAVLLSRSIEPDPDLLDMFAVLAIWVGAVSSRIFVFDKWLAVAVWFIVAGLIGGVLQIRKFQRKSTKPPVVSNTAQLFDPITHRKEKRILRRIWESWQWFALRLSAFQSKVLLMLFYFIIVAPFGLALRTFGDPMRLKRARSLTGWLSRTDPTPTFNESRRQF